MAALDFTIRIEEDAPAQQPMPGTVQVQPPAPAPQESTAAQPAPTTSQPGNVQSPAPPGEQAPALQPPLDAQALILADRIGVLERRRQEQELEDSRTRLEQEAPLPAEQEQAREDRDEVLGEAGADVEPEPPARQPRRRRGRAAREESADEQAPVPEEAPVPTVEQPEPVARRELEQAQLDDLQRREAATSAAPTVRPPESSAPAAPATPPDEPPQSWEDAPRPRRRGRRNRPAPAEESPRPEDLAQLADLRQDQEAAADEPLATPPTADETLQSDVAGSTAEETRLAELRRQAKELREAAKAARIARQIEKFEAEVAKQREALAKATETGAANAVDRPEEDASRPGDAAGPAGRPETVERAEEAIPLEEVAGRPPEEEKPLAAESPGLVGEPPAAPAPVAPMPASPAVDRISVECPECRQLLIVGGHYAGQLMKCPRCQGRLIIPGAGEMAEPAAAIETSRPAEPEMARPEPLEAARPAGEPEQAFPGEPRTDLDRPTESPPARPAAAPPETPRPEEFVGPPAPEQSSAERAVLAERRRREQEQKWQRELEEARANFDPYSVRQQKGFVGPMEPADLQPEGFVGPIEPPRPTGGEFVGPPEPPPLAISARDDARRQQKDAASRADFEGEVLREKDPREEARRQIQQKEDREAFDKEVRLERNRLDPEEATKGDLGAAGRLAGQAGMPGAGKVLGNVGEASKIGEALGGIGEAGGLEAAAGPIGAVVAIADVAAGQLAGAMDSTRKTIERFGDDLADVANNQYMSVFNREVDAAAESLKKVPIVGQVWAAELELAVQPIRSFTDVVNAFVARGKELAHFSADLSLAQAQMQVRGTLADVEEADRLGPGIARLTTAQDEIWHEIRTILLPVKEFIIEQLATILEEVRDDMPQIKAFLKSLAETLAAIFQRLTPWTNITEEMLRAIVRGLEESKEAKGWIGTEDMIRQILGDRAPDDPRFLPTKLLDAERGLGIPAVPGGF